MITEIPREKWMAVQFANHAADTGFKHCHDYLNRLNAGISGSEKNGVGQIGDSLNGPVCLFA
jgi:hypothetical protein